MESSSDEPPPVVHHPLHLLDQFLLSLPPSSHNQTEDSSNERNEKILRIADFLYGKSTNTSSRLSYKKNANPMPSQQYAGSILDSALELLDSFEEELSQVPSMPLLGDGANADRGRLKTSAPIRMVVAKRSRRRFVVVRGSKGRVGTDYLVTLGSHSNSTRSDGGVANAHTAVIAGRWGYHCSCRSFFEKLKGDRFALCKHILAARLAPFLCISIEDENGRSRSRIYKEEEIEDEEFGIIYARLSLTSWY